MRKNKVRFYTSFSDDFEQSADQNYVLPDDYKWIRTDIISKIVSGLVYGAAVVFGAVYCKLFLHIRIKGRKKLRRIKDGFFVYGNHTQPIGDVFIPALCTFPKRIYTVVSTANYGIPVIGKVLPYLGALPIVNTINGVKELNRAVKTRIQEKKTIVIYPEAHVWEYYTDIRPFSYTSFSFPVKNEKGAFAMTVTYRRSNVFKRPLTEVFIDGPFYAQGENEREKRADLYKKICDIMKERSKNSNVNFIEYKQK